MPLPLLAFNVYLIDTRIHFNSNWLWPPYYMGVVVIPHDVPVWCKVLITHLYCKRKCSIHDLSSFVANSDVSRLEEPKNHDVQCGVWRWNQSGEVELLGADVFNFDVDQFREFEIQPSERIEWMSPSSTTLFSQRYSVFVPFNKAIHKNIDGAISIKQQTESSGSTHRPGFLAGNRLKT